MEISTLMAFAQEAKRIKLKKAKIQVAKLVIAAALIEMHSRMRVSNKLTRADLIHPSQSSWYVLRDSRSDAGFLDAMGVNVAGLETLLRAFSPYYEVRSGPGRVGRPPALPDKGAALACVLHFYRTSLELVSLCEIFGLPRATLSRVLENGEAALERALRDLSDARVTWPSFEKQQEMAARIKARHPLLDGRFGFVDGKNYKVEQSGDVEIQNGDYNGILCALRFFLGHDFRLFFIGWHHCCYVTGVFAFGADGCIFWGKHNFPGSWNDAETSRGLQARLLNPDLTLAGHGLIADTAFPTLEGKIQTPLKDNDWARIPHALRRQAREVSRQITTARQAIEWGMGATLKVFRQLDKKLSSDRLERGRRLENVHRLYNFRVRTTGISQIRSVYYGSE